MIIWTIVFGWAGSTPAPDRLRSSPSQLSIIISVYSVDLSLDPQNDTLCLSVVICYRAVAVKKAGRAGIPRTLIPSLFTALVLCAGGARGRERLRVEPPKHVCIYMYKMNEQ